ncbi:SMP-30/gluconolactonase/LRE family protein [Pararhizobium sp. IMCC21322]|uniref:SMP-30/gluconolactonase/LRE family protein n=1 Tax=Pararhizobium sp. IMCC21322 TaxID=3067903 RepID=UPI002741A304|nr:SMP-30/gluconolactonase/LRE family protein [Pararhizobium sp. IMCC21322]
MSDVSLAVEIKAKTGESPVWSKSKNALYFVDIVGGTIHCFSPSENRLSRWDFGQYVGCLAEKRSGGLVVAAQHGIYSFDIETGGKDLVSDIEAHLPDNRFNDGAVDSHGRLWAGTMKIPQIGSGPVGRIYSIDGAYRVREHLSGLSIVNGIAFSPDNRTFYAGDTFAEKVWAFDFDADAGIIENRRLFVDFSALPGRPDGAAVDEDGFYWIATPGGWEICRFAPNGKLDRRVPMPVEMPTSLAFGGEKNDKLFITSLSGKISTGTEDRQPLAGSVFVYEPGVCGAPVYNFAG